MQVKVRKLSEVKAELRITNTAEEVEEAYQAAYKSARKSIKVPGFRKGKAPVEMLEKHLGERVVEDAIRKLLTQNLEQCLKNLEPKPASLPDISIKSFERHKGAAFVGDYDLPAKLTLGKYKKIEVSQDLPQADPESVQKRLEVLQRYHVSIHSREEEEGAQMKDLLELSLRIKHKDEKLFQAKKQKFVLDEKHMLPGIPEQVLGMKLGEEKSFQLSIAEDFADSKYAGKELDVQLKLAGCSYEELPVLDDEFARDCGDFENLTELKEKIRTKLQEKAQKILEENLKNEIVAKAVSDSKIMLPERQVQGMSEELLQSFFGDLKWDTSQKKLSIEEVARLMNKNPEELQAKFRKQSEFMLGRFLVLYEIGDTENMSLEEKDLEKVLRAKLPPSIPDEELDLNVKSAMKALRKKDREEARAMYRRAYLEKVIDWLHANAKIKPGKEISISQLIEDKILDEAVFEGSL